MTVFHYGSDQMTVHTAMQIASGKLKTKFSSDTISKIQKSVEIIEEILENDEIVYGINTGFGPLCTTKISKEETKQLQKNLLMSHAVGVGEPIDPIIAKYMMILKVHNLSYGHSGIRLLVLERILWHIESDIIPRVPSQGSVGASGDLAPLSHLFLPLLGLGEVIYKGARTTSSEMLKREGIDPIELSAKEGLALINGTQFIAAHAIELVHKMRNLIDHADLIGAIMIDGLQGSLRPFYPELHQLRPYSGSIQSASNVFRLLEHSEIMKSHEECNKVQDPYSLRCLPQVHGAARNALTHLNELLEIEMNSVTDNPVIINKKLIISGGNFHGEPLAIPLDYACIAASEISNISDRRIYLSLEGKNDKVPQMLIRGSGLNSGFMILQYTTAALVSENKGLCYPASADSIPTSMGQEDHVSMGSIGARKALRVVNNAQTVQSIELICALQAIEFHAPLKSSPYIMEVFDYVRSLIDFVEKDRIMYKLIESSQSIIESNELLRISNFSNQFDA